MFLSTVYENILWSFRFSEVTGCSSCFVLSLKEKSKCRYMKVKCDILIMKVKCSLISPLQGTYDFSPLLLVCFYCILFFMYVLAQNILPELQSWVKFIMFCILDEAINVFNMFFLTFQRWKDWSKPLLCHSVKLVSLVCFFANHHHMVKISSYMHFN